MKFSDMKRGQEVRVVPGGFTCMAANWGDIVYIREDARGLWVPCSGTIGFAHQEKHYLSEDVADENGDFPEFILIER